MEHLSTNILGKLGRLGLLGVLGLLWLISSCQGGGEQRPLPRTLTVGTLYSPTSFFILRGDTLGYDYDRICAFARAKGITLQFKVADNMSHLIEMLERDSVQLLAYEIPITAEYKAHVLPCGAVNETYQVLVQPTGDSLLTDVTQLLRAQLLEQNNATSDDQLNDMGYFNVDNLSVTRNFYFDQDGVTWSYLPSQLAVDAVGEPQITLTYDQLAPLACDGSVINRLH